MPPFKELKGNSEDDKDFIDRCCRVVFREIGSAQAKYFGGKAQGKGRLHNGLPYFLCGGGSGVGVYRSIPTGVKPFMKNYHFEGFKKEILEKPENLTFGCDKEDYQRLSVAYGLSMHILNLPEQQGFVDALMNKDRPTPSSNYVGRRVCRAANCDKHPIVGSDLCYDCS